MAITGTYVIGVDVSLSSTGVAALFIEPDGMAYFMRLHSIVPPKGCTGVDRLIWIADEFGDLVAGVAANAKAQGFALRFAFEGYAFGGVGRIAGLAEVGGVLRVVAARAASMSPQGGLVYDVPPATLKQIVTGKGNVKKDDMLRAVSFLGIHSVRNDDEADAVLLATVGGVMATHSLSLANTSVDLLAGIVARTTAAAEGAKIACVYHQGASFSSRRTR